MQCGKRHRNGSVGRIFLPGTPNFTVNDSKRLHPGSHIHTVNSYALFANAVQEATKFSPSRLELKIDYFIQVQGKTDAGDFTDELHPTLIIPLQGRVFAVQGELSPEKEGAIEAETTRPAEGIQTTNIGLGIGWFLAALLCIGFLMLTRSSDKDLSPEERNWLHSSPTRGQSSDPDGQFAHSQTAGPVLLVDDFEDLVKALMREQPIPMKRMRNRENTVFL